MSRMVQVLKRRCLSEYLFSGTSCDFTGAPQSPPSTSSEYQIHGQFPFVRPGDERLGLVTGASHVSFEPWHGIGWSGGKDLKPGGAPRGTVQPIPAHSEL